MSSNEREREIRTSHIYVENSECCENLLELPALMKNNIISYISHISRSTALLLSLSFTSPKLPH